MNKLPVGGSVRFAYAFTFRELGTIIGLIWVPLVLLAIVNFLPYALGDTMPSPDINPSAAGTIMLRGIGLWLISVLLSACIYVPVTRQALGLRTGPAFIHIALGRAELRLWAAYLLFIAILMVLFIGFMLALFASALAAGATGNKAFIGGVILLVAFAGMCGLLYAMTRLGFLIAPVVVAEDKVSFERSWTLTQGNFWRIAGILFLVTLPPAIIFLSAFAWLLGPELMALFHQALATHMPQQALAERVNAITTSHISTMLGIQLIIAPFSVGLVSSAAAFAYKALAANAPVSTPQP
ncbi:MAG TPA: hypothetical protein VHE09_03465 [Rhizomicrobium sp.]|nr:hypothetical protein [Rhizomicrobium sp.]